MREYYLKNKNKINQYTYEHTKSHQDGLFHVYITDKDYAGQTKNVYARKIAHKYNGKDVTDFRVIASFTTRQEALIFEEQLHTKGYRGRSAVKLT